MSEDQEKDEFFDPVTVYKQADPLPPEQKKKSVARRVLAIVLAVVLLGVGFLIGWFVRYYTIDEDARAFLWAMDVTEKHYYLDIDKDRVYAEAEGKDGKAHMASLVSQLDKYSAFYTEEEYAAVAAAGEGQNDGIGVAVYDETVNGVAIPRVLIIVENSPAQKAGVKKGMYLLGFGEDESQMQSGDSDALIDYISSKRGTFSLKVGFSADGSDAKVVSLKRAAYQAAYCYYRDSETSYSFRGTGSTLSLTETFSPIEGLNDTTAYIRLDEFSGNAAEEFASCLSVMKERERKDLILDLRTNGGGYLTIFQSIASHLLKNAGETRPVVASAQYKSGKEAIYRSYSDSDYDKYFSEDSKVYLLADENTASASECLIGALIDYGTLSYENIYLRAADDTGFAATYGKGIMQSFYFGSLGVMKLTVARICWPSGNCIHGVGVTTENGAHGVKADLVWGKEDVMLNALLADIS